MASLLCGLALTAGNHVTSVENTGDRTWMCVSSEGTVRVSFADKDSFGKPYVVRPQERSSASFGQLWLAPDGRLHLYYTETDGYFDGKGRLMCKVCAEPLSDAPSWSDASEVGVGVCTGKPAVASDGRWVMPAALWGRTLMGDAPDLYGNAVHNREDNGQFRELDFRRGPLTYTSEDSGTTWSMRSGVVVVPEKMHARYNDPQIIRCLDGSLKMILRSSGTGWSYSSVSKTDGRFWTPAVRFVQNPDRKAAFMKLPDGKLLMVKQGKLDSFRYVLGRGLYAYLSDTEGETWYGGLCIDPADDAASPAVTHDTKGNIMIAYDKGEGNVCLTRTSQEEIVRGMVDPALVAQDTRVVAEYKAPKTKAVKPGKLTSKETIRICSYNIQYRNDKLCKWTHRLEALKGFMDEYRPDVMGTQEPYTAQIDDMMEVFGDEYAWFGINVDDQWQPPYRPSAAFNPIFYRKDRVKVLEWDVVWYTPEAGKRGYGADYPRFLTWARMQDLRTGKEFHIFNSHFDHKGVEARELSAEILVDAVRRIAGGGPAVLTGDYNSTETSIPYATIMNSGFLDNSKLAVKNAVNHMYYSQARYKPINTVSQKDIHIDHIFYTPANSRVESWELVIKTFGGYHGSDHLPIVIDWRL